MSPFWDWAQLPWSSARQREVEEEKEEGEGDESSAASQFEDSFL